MMLRGAAMASKGMSSLISAILLDKRARHAEAKVWVRTWRGSMVDRYTKAVLTVIAAALVAIVVQNSINSSAAQGPNVPKVQVCDAGGNCVSVLQNKKGIISLNVTPTNPYLR